MNKIVKGNDFTFTLCVTTLTADGTKSVLDLTSATDLSVALVAPFARIPLTHTLTDPENGILTARVEGDQTPIGTYGIEVKGRQNGDDFRCFETRQIAIVSRNAEASLDPTEIRVTTPMAQADLLGTDLLVTDDGETYLTAK